MLIPSTPLFKLGQVVLTPGAIEILQTSGQSPWVFLARHLRGDWGAVDCQVLEIEPHKTLSYRWDAMGLESIVTWTLTPTRTGTHLRVEQAGFRRDQEQAFQVRLAKILRQPGAGLGAHGVNSASS